MVVIIGARCFECFERADKIERRYAEAGAFPTRYWRPDVHVAAFALPTYVRELVEG